MTVSIGSPESVRGCRLSPDCLDREGFIKCKVLPLRILYHAVPSYKSKSKLRFPFCSACADRMNQGDCTHSDEERRIVGTWVVDEVHKAVEMGHDVVDTFEFCEYEVTYFDRDSNAGGLFAEYVDIFLKLKQVTSGYPSLVQS